MYSNEDINLLNKSIKNRSIILLLFSALFLCLIIFSFVIRIKILSVGFSICLGFFLTFFLSIYFLPLVKYRQALEIMLSGRKKSIQGIVKVIDKSSEIIDGIESYKISTKTGEDRHGDIEALLYLDTNKYSESIQVGKKYEFTEFNRFIFDYNLIKE